jgi:hypothetical protein
MLSLLDARALVADPDLVAVALSLAVTAIAFAHWLVAAGDDWLAAEDEDEDDERPGRRPSS